MSNLTHLREVEGRARIDLAGAFDDCAAALRLRDDERATYATRRAMRLADLHEQAKAALRLGEAEAVRDRMLAASDGPEVGR